jgi:hypothetical protein
LGVPKGPAIETTRKTNPIIENVLIEFLLNFDSANRTKLATRPDKNVLITTGAMLNGLPSGNKTFFEMLPINVEIKNMVKFNNAAINPARNPVFIKF